MQSFLLLPWYVLGLLVVFSFVLISLLGLILVRRLITPDVLKDNHSVTGIAFNVVGVLYAVLLGFTVLNVQTRFQNVSQTAESEASLVLDLFRSADVFSSADSKNIRSLLQHYVHSVIESEWLAMANGKSSLKTSRIIHDLWLTYSNIHLSTEKEKIWYSISIDQLNNLNNYRSSRIFNSRESLGSMMWTLLLLGGLIITCFFYFFWMEPFYLQIIMNSLLAGNVAFMLFLTFILDNPFLGDRSIHPTALESVLKTFHRWEESDLLKSESN